MNRRTVVFGILAVAVGSSNESLASNWPKLIDGKNEPCAEALQIAKLAFDSSAFYLFAPPEVPPKLRSSLVLGPQSLDISGGDSLTAEPAAFDKLPIGGEGSPRSVYWQKAQERGYRLAMVETPYGWQGDMYTLFTIPETVLPDEFLAKVRKSTGASKFAAVVSSSWRPPLVFQSKDSGPTWIIDVGQPYQFLADWRIHIVEPEGVNLRCTVQFRPPVKSATELLPLPVRTLAHLLDQTMGPGENEGTLQSTARLRLDAAYTWANAALRPWALGTPYNTRVEVDQGLTSWSHTGDAFRKVYQAVKRQYPIAEQSLARYYQANFDLSARDAQVRSAYVLDVALRSYYTFHREDPNNDLRDHNSEPNPWRSK